MSVQGHGSTAPYDTANGALYARIARVPLGLWDEPVFSNTLVAVIRLHSLKSTGQLVSKEYAVGFNGTSVRIRDLTAGNPGPDLAATVTDGITELYVSGHEQSAGVRVQLLYCNRPGMIELIPQETFSVDLSTGTVYRPTRSTSDYKSYPFVFKSGWALSSGRGRMYSANGIVYVDFAITGGTGVGGNFSPFDLPVPTTEGKEFPVVFTDTDGSLKVARATINGSGTFAIVGVTVNTLVSGSFFYRMVA